MACCGRWCSLAPALFYGRRRRCQGRAASVYYRFFIESIYISQFSGKNRLFFSAWPFLLTARFPRIYAGFQHLRRRNLARGFSAVFPKVLWFVFPKVLWCIPKSFVVYSQKFCGVFLPNFYFNGVNRLSFLAGFKAFYISLVALVFHGAPVF
jgi:hypothetical protein